MINFRIKPIHFLMATILTTGLIISFPEITLGVVDLIPPEITAISPSQNSVIETARPWIEAEFGDSGAGIDETAVFLALDQLNVTAQSVIENLGLTGQTGNNRYRIHYQPKISLSQGEHEVYFSVRDQAGNLAELRWKFEVAASEPVKILFSGTNTLQWDETPLMKTTDVLDLAAQTKVADTDVRLQLLTHSSDYPGGTPNFQADQFRFYLDKYSLSLTGQTSTLLLGFGATPLQSELFQSGMEVRGGIYTQKIHFTQGRLDWNLFSGESGGAYGLNIDVKEIHGMTCGWESSSGWNIGTFYVQLGGDAGYDVMGFQGNTLSDNGLLTRFEWGAQNSKNNGISENGLAFHLGQSFQAFTVGLDYFRLQPNRRPEESSLSFSQGQGGVQQIGIRTVTEFNQWHSLGLNISLAEDNLDRISPSTVKQGNIGLDYSFIPDPGFNLNINYIGGLHDTQGSSDSGQESDQTLALRLKKNLTSATGRESTLQTSLSLNESQPAAPLSEGMDFFSAWTCPVGLYNLTPSLKLTQTKETDNDFYHTAETRLTLDFQTSSALPRNKVALLWNTTPPLTTLGLESTVNWLLWLNSTLSCVCNVSHWVREDSGPPEGWDRKIAVVWKVSF
jgi:hypothetical protein